MTPPPDERALWAAIAAAPGDDLPRLVRADWLEDRGRPERADPVRVQCRLAALPADRRRARADRARLQAREVELLAAHGAAWLAPCAEALDGPTLPRGGASSPGPAGRLRFARGLPDFDGCGLAAGRLIAADLGPVNRFELTDDVRGVYSPEGLEAVAAWALAGRVREVYLGYAADRDLFAVAGSATLTNLRAVRVFSGEVTDAGVAALARWPHAARISDLDLYGVPVTDAGAAALADSPFLPGLTRLELHGTEVTGAGADRLRERFGDAVDVA